MDLGGYRFLVVDDHSLMRQMVVSELRCNNGQSIIEAIDGVDGLKKIRQAKEENAPFDIVFLDLSMPQMDGFAVLKACRADKALDGMAIVMVTSESEDLNVLQALEEGATAYITKPFLAGDVSSKLEDVLLWVARSKGGAHG